MTDYQTPSSSERSTVPGSHRRRDAAAHPAASDRLGAYAFTVSAISAIAYFSTSEGIRNYLSFLVDGVGKLARLFGLGP